MRAYKKKYYAGSWEKVVHDDQTEGVKKYTFCRGYNLVIGRLKRRTYKVAYWKLQGTL